MQGHSAVEKESVRGMKRRQILITEPVKTTFTGLVIEVTYDENYTALTIEG